MKIHFSYQDIDENSKKVLEDYLTDEKLQGLVRLLQHGNFDLADLDIRVEYMPHHNNFLLKINLDIAKRVLVSEESAYSLTEAFDLALEKIISQLRKLENIRHKK